MKCSLLIICLLLSGAALATPRQAPISELKPNSALIPRESALSCEQSIFRRSYKSTPLRESLYKYELVKYTDFLISQGFHISSYSLSRESALAQQMIFDRYQVNIPGRLLYQERSKFFKSVADLVKATTAGRRLTKQKNDVDHKSWTMEILVKLAKECYQAGIPLDRDFLLENSSFVGKKLSSIYGYPVRGENIVYRLEKLGLSLDDLIKEAGLPDEPEKILTPEYKIQIPRTQDLVIEIFSFLKMKGLDIVQSRLVENNDHLRNLVFDRFGFYTDFYHLEEIVYEVFEGWPDLKRQIGYTYEGRSQHYVGRPDWTKDFYASLLKVIHESNYEISYRMFRHKENYEPIRLLLLEHFKYDISGKSMYERAEDLFGSLEKAADYAHVPYANFNQQLLPAQFDQWTNQEEIEKISPQLLLQILKIVDKLGYDPVKTFFEDQYAFSLVSDQLQELIQMEVTGDQIIATAKKIYGPSFNKAIKAADLNRSKLFGKPERGHLSETLVKAVILVTNKFPHISASDMKGRHSLEINKILKQELSLNVSGYSLWKELRRQGNQMVKDDDHYERGYTASTRYVRALQTAMIIESNNHGDRTEVLDYKGVKFDAGRDSIDSREFAYNFTDKDFFDQVMLYIAEDLEIFPTRTNLLNPKFSGRITNALYNKFKTEISIMSILRGADRYYQGLDGYRRVFSYGDKNPKYFAFSKSDKEILEYLRFILQRYPDISATDFYQDYSQIIAADMKAHFRIKLAGKTLKSEIDRRFGSLAEARKELEIVVPWTRAFPPNPDEVLNTLLYLRSLGYEKIDRSLIQDKAQSKYIESKLSEYLGFELMTTTIYHYSHNLFGESGFHQANEYIDSLITLSSESKIMDIEIPRFSNQKLSKETVLSILRRIREIGFDPVEPFLTRADSFSRVSNIINEEFGISVSGFELLILSKQLFDSHEKALEQSGLTIQTYSFNSSDTEPTKDFLEIFGFVLERYPRIPANDLQWTHSTEIADLIKKEFNIITSGFSIWREATRQARKFNTFENSNDFTFISNRARAYNREKKSASLWWPPKTIPEKEKLDEVLSYLKDHGLELQLREFTTAKHTEKTTGLLYKKLGYNLPLAAVKAAVNHYYGDFRKVRQEFGMNKKKPVFDLSRDQLFEIVKIVAEKHPEATASTLRAGQSREIGKTIEENFGFYMAGEHFAKMVYAEFGGYAKAKKLLEED